MKKKKRENQKIERKIQKKGKENKTKSNAK